MSIGRSVTGRGGHPGWQEVGSSYLSSLFSKFSLFIIFFIFIFLMHCLFPTMLPQVLWTAVVPCRTVKDFSFHFCGDSAYCTVIKNILKSLKGSVCVYVAEVGIIYLGILLGASSLCLCLSLVFPVCVCLSLVFPVCVCLPRFPCLCLSVSLAFLPIPSSMFSL